MSARSAKIKIPLIPNQMVMIQIADLTPVSQPYRKISPGEFEKLKISIDKDKDFFTRRPCLVNRINDQLIVYAGNQRMDAAIALGWTEVPCIIHEITAEEQERRMLKDNVHAGVFDLAFMETAYDRDFLMNEVGFNMDLLTPEQLLKPDDLVEQTPIDNRLYAFFNGEKIFVDDETDKWLMAEIKEFGDRTTTIFGFMEHMKKYYELGILQ